MNAQLSGEHDQASSLAYRVGALIDVCLFAHDNETSSVQHYRRGIDQVLKMASDMAGELIDLVEHLEKDLLAAKGGED
ncbi:hypothetical protein [Pseudooceanicola sp. MF1-13]|uniref:hypothetical protein n=1 Tax=Pseudooceanicola sp. MF1-13 TaxID=3379095 RepID=UPI003891D47D